MNKTNIDITLENDLKWREAELIALKKLAIMAPKKSVVYYSLLRAMWALLYAHFEGYTKFCWDTLLDRVQSEKLTRKQLDEKFLLIALEKDFGKLRGNLDGLSIWNFFSTEVHNLLLGTAEFPEDTRLQTECNLWPNIFERESKRVGIECNELNTHRTRIRTLVARRNDIAHGKGMIIEEITEYSEYESATLCLMHELAIKTMDIIEQEKYKSQNTT